MTNYDASLKVGDFGGTWTWTLSDANGAVDLTDASDVVFRMQHHGTGNGEKAPGAGTTTKADAANGVVTYTFAAADTAVRGVFDCDMEVTFADKVITFPRPGNKTLQIEN